jgi:hypothetical protein
MAGTASPVTLDQDATDAKQEKMARRQEVGQPDRATAEISEKRMQSQILRLNNEFGILNFPDGDTFAYIGPPPRTLTEVQTWEHAYSQNHFSFPHRVHSSNFLSLNAKRFNDLFGPRSVRIERRFRRERILSGVSTEGIKFFVDLRPPTEEDEAVLLLTNLTCTKGVLTWHTAQDKYGLSPLLVAGQDDSSSIPVDFHLPVTRPGDEQTSKGPKPSHSKKASDVKEEPWDKERFNSREAQHDEDLTELDGPEKDAGLQSAIASSLERPAPAVAAAGSPSPKVSEKEPTAPTSKQLEEPVATLPEYSPLRHRSAIERLIQAIENGDPKLDSAPKVWTFFAVAKYFDCASHERIRRWITKWLLNYPNCNFIQSNPEVALRIGLGIQSENITKDAFSILVGEKSLLNVFGESIPSILSPLVQSVHGRKLELLDDDERNRIDHAAASLVRRIRQKFDDLICGEMSWLQQSSQYMKIFSVVPRNEDEVDVVNNLIQKVKQFVRGRIIWVLCRTYDDDFSDFEQDLKKVRTFYPGTRDMFKETYNKLNERERIFTRFFWIALQREDFVDGTVNLWTERVSKLGLPCVGRTNLSQMMCDRTLPSGERLCQIVSKEEVVASIVRFNHMGRSNNSVNEQTKKQTKRTVFQTPPSREVETVLPTEDEVAVPFEQSAKPAQQKSPSSWAYNSLKCFKSLYDTSAKREQTTIPLTPLTEKRRKLSDADVGSGVAPATSSPFKPLQIRSRVTKPTERYEEIFLCNYNGSENSHLEMPVHQADSAPSCNSAIDAEAARQNIVPELSEPVGSLTEEVETRSGTYRFGHDNSRGQIFRPILPNLPSSGLSMKDATFRQHIADVSPKPSLSPDDHENRAGMIISDGQGADPEINNESRPFTAAEYSYDTDEVATGRVVTAADWSFQADDVDWTLPQVKQFSDHYTAQPTHSQPGYLSYVVLLNDIGGVLHRIADEIINPAHLFHGDNLLPTDLIDNLICLNDDEWKYLPLWAGGNDDGTGGVFDEVDVPNLEVGGFQGGKRGIGSVRASGASSSVSESSFDDIGSDAISTVGKASRAATDGTATVKSLSDIGSEGEGFMRQNELWDEIRNMKLDEARQVRSGIENGAEYGRARDEDFDDDFDVGMDEQDAYEVDTVVGARSTDGDDDTMDAEEGPDFSSYDDEGNDDDDMEIIHADDL